MHFLFIIQLRRSIFRWLGGASEPLKKLKCNIASCGRMTAPLGARGLHQSGPGVAGRRWPGVTRFVDICGNDVVRRIFSGKRAGEKREIEYGCEKEINTAQRFPEK
jgi:hypothetical protein